MAWARDPISRCMCIRMNREDMMSLEMHIKTVFRLAMGMTPIVVSPLSEFSRIKCVVFGLNGLNGDVKLQIDGAWDVPIKHSILRTSG